MRQTMKRALSVLLALIMAFSLAATALAEGEGSGLESFYAVIDPANLTMEAGETNSASVILYQSDGLIFDYENYSFRWASGNSGVVDVASGFSSPDTADVIARAAGTASVTCIVTRAADGETTHASINVTVRQAAAPLSVSINGSSTLNMTAGESQNISASISGGSGSYSYNWGGTGIAAVSDYLRHQATVYATQAGEGEVSLTVSDGENPGNYKTVYWSVSATGGAEPITASISPASLSLSSGETRTLTVSASGGSGNNSNYTYNWYATSGLVQVSGNGASASVTGGAAGSAAVKVDVYDKVTRTVATEECTVTVQSRNISYNASASATVGSSLSFNQIAQAIAAEYQRQTGSALSYSASTRISSPSSSVGTIRMQDDTPLSANASITYAQLMDIGFRPTAAGTFSTPYTITGESGTISGNISISVSGGVGVSAATLSLATMSIPTYSSQYLTLSVSPGNASYRVAWSSSHNGIAVVSGGGSSVVISSQGNIGSAVITAVVTDANGATITRTCTVNVYANSSGGNSSTVRTYDPSVTVTLGSDYYGSDASESMAKQFRSSFGITLNENAIIRFSNTGSTRNGVLHLYNGNVIQSNVDYTFNQWVDMYFEPVAAGTFSIPYTLTYRGYTLKGTLYYYVRNANVSVSISSASMTLAPYSNQYLNVNVSPANAYYQVAWRSSNTNVVTVAGNGVSATVSSGGQTGTATVYATVTDRSGVQLYKTCTVTVSNSGANNYNPSVSMTLGVNYTGTGTSDAMINQFRGLYSIDLSGSTAKSAAKIRFANTGNSAVGILRLTNGTAIRPNTDYTLAQYATGMYVEPVAAGTFSLPYTLTYQNRTLSGTVSFVITRGSVSASLELNEVKPYQFSQTAANGASGSAQLSSAITNAVGFSWNYLRFNNSASNVGTLYLNSGRGSVSSANITSGSLGNLYFVPNQAGPFSIGFTVYNASGSELAAGTLYLNVATGSAATFTDVTSDKWFFDSVRWAVLRQITTGTGNGQFSPDNTCTTAEILTFLWRAKGSPAPSINNPYTDVNSSNYYYQAALWAYQNGLVDGTSFNGSTPCTRASVVTYMWRLAGRPAAQASSFTDVSAGTEMTSAVNWAVSSGVTTGTGNGQFSPNMTCTRAQIVTFLNRAYA